VMDRWFDSAMIDNYFRSVIVGCEGDQALLGVGDE
jgi:hypothetical protein